MSQPHTSTVILGGNGTKTPSTPTTAGEHKSTIFTGILDATDGMPIAIENRGAQPHAERIAIRAKAGKVQVASYNASGTAKMNVYQLDWAPLGLKGQPWEYLGSVFELDITEKNRFFHNLRSWAEICFSYRYYIFIIYWCQFIMC